MAVFSPNNEFSQLGFNLEEESCSRMFSVPVAPALGLVI
jgi:hypothetical protein